MFKGYKTIVFNVVMGLVLFIRAMSPESELPDAESVEGAVDAVGAAFAAVWGIGNVILRAITDSPIFKKEPENT